VSRLQRDRDTAVAAARQSESASKQAEALAKQHEAAAASAKQQSDLLARELERERKEALARAEKQPGELSELMARFERERAALLSDKSQATAALANAQQQVNDLRDENGRLQRKAQGYSPPPQHGPSRPSSLHADTPVVPLCLRAVWR
jgi:hypothetical protein